MITKHKEEFKQKVLVDKNIKLDQDNLLFNKTLKFYYKFTDNSPALRGYVVDMRGSNWLKFKRF